MIGSIMEPNSKGQIDSSSRDDDRSVALARSGARDAKVQWRRGLRPLGEVLGRLVEAIKSKRSTHVTTPPSGRQMGSGSRSIPAAQVSAYRPPRRGGSS